MSSWWMMLYGCPSPKRLMARANWNGISGLDIGKLSLKQRRESTTIVTTRLDLIYVENACVGNEPLPFWGLVTKDVQGRNGLGQRTWYKHSHDLR